MSDFGITSDGFKIRAFTDILEDKAARARDVFGGDPAGGLDARIPCAGVDVGDVEAIPEEGYALEGHGLLRGGTVGIHAELLGLEVGEEVVRLDVVEERRERVVELGLRIGARAGEPVLPRGEDVPGDDRRIGVSGSEGVR